MSIFVDDSNNIKNFNIVSEIAGKNILLLAKSDEISLGILEATFEDGEYSITDIFVRPEYRRHLIGSRLLYEFMELVDKGNQAPINIMYTLKPDKKALNALLEGWPGFEIVTVGHVFSEKLSVLLEKPLLKKMIQHAGDFGHLRPVKDLNEGEIGKLMLKLNEHELTDYANTQDLLNNVDGRLSAIKEKDGQIVAAILIDIDENGIHIDNVFSDKEDMLGFGELLSYSLTRDITKYKEMTVDAVATSDRVKKISQELFGREGNELKLAFGR